LLATPGQRPPTRAADASLLDVLQLAGGGREGRDAGVAAHGLRHRGACGQLLFDELLERQAVALLERGAKGLAMIGQDNQIIGARRLLLDGLVDPGNNLVIGSQHLEGVAGPGARMMRHFVVAGPGDVDAGRPADDVEQGQVGGDVAHEDGHGGPHERIPVGQAVEARLHVLALLPPALPQFPHDVHQQQDGGAHQEVGVEQEPIEVLGAAFLLIFTGIEQIGQGQQRLLGIAVQHVVDARAAAQEAIAVGKAAVEFGGIRAGHIELLLVLVIPAKGRNIAVVAEHDAGLAGRGLRGDAAIDP
jgi:hypothetical protein